MMKIAGGKHGLGSGTILTTTYKLAKAGLCPYQIDFLNIAHELQLTTTHEQFIQLIHR